MLFSCLLTYGIKFIFKKRDIMYCFIQICNRMKGNFLLFDLRQTKKPSTHIFYFLKTKLQTLKKKKNWKSKGKFQLLWLVFKKRILTFLKVQKKHSQVKLILTQWMREPQTHRAAYKSLLQLSKMLQLAALFISL